MVGHVVFLDVGYQSSELAVEGQRRVEGVETRLKDAQGDSNAARSCPP